MVNSNTGQEFEWTSQKFLDRLYLMKEMYHNYETGEEEWDLPFVSWHIQFAWHYFCWTFLLPFQDQDPFMEDLQSECLVGTAQLYLQPLAYRVELKEQLSLTDFSGQEIGIINLEVIPCNEHGNEYQEHDDVYVDSPQELLGKPFNFIVKILGCRGLPPKFTVG